MAQIAAFIAVYLFVLIMILAALNDAATMKIRNRYVCILIVGFAALAPPAGFGWDDLSSHATVAGIVLVATFGLFSFGWIGGGDAKLAAATALWLGLDHTLIYLAYTGIIGGGLTLLLLAFRAMPQPVVLQGIGWLERLHSPRTGVPYAVAMAPAALLVVPDTHWFAVLAL